MASASGGLFFLNWLGVISGPLLTGYLMTQMGSERYFIILGYFARLSDCLRLLKDDTAWIFDVDTSSYATVLPTASVIAVEIAQ